MPNNLGKEHSHFKQGPVTPASKTKGTHHHVPRIHAPQPYPSKPHKPDTWTTCPWASTPHNYTQSSKTAQSPHRDPSPTAAYQYPSTLLTSRGFSPVASSRSTTPKLDATIVLEYSGGTYPTSPKSPQRKLLSLESKDVISLARPKSIILGSKSSSSKTILELMFWCMIGGWQPW
ncbi:Cdc2-like protein kinase [Striga asiatica]|uniref:Cdc2-like protein kinase n=1 Tax=Striga asiatica TaxID=4170 RepID=A0A5A7PVS1_STRAF|nr:Cdc2-like protein kinase [Striga asiatica]